jgi:hypothetical protein
VSGDEVRLDDVPSIPAKRPGVQRVRLADIPTGEETILAEVDELVREGVLIDVTETS